MTMEESDVETVLPANAKSWTTRHDDRAAWPPGPWNDEPDKVSWTDPATGRPCLIVRNSVGALCGYVAVDPGHPLHGAGYDDVDVEVHGGLTFSAGCSHSDDESEGICHVPEPGQPDDVHWFGFDCAHAFDLAPGMLLYGGWMVGDVYRTVAYVAAECASLARQLCPEQASSND